MNKENQTAILEQIKKHHEVEPFIEEYGNGSPLVTIVACMHGNEHVGLRVLELLRNQTIFKGTLRLVVANPNATLQNRRFVDSDLNRSFPGKEEGGIEEQLASKLRQRLSDTDVLIDLHSTTAVTPPFLIARKDNKDTRRFVNASGIERVVVKPKPSKTALIDYGENRFGVELGRHDSDEALASGLLVTISVLSELGMVKRENIQTNIKPEIFVVEEVIPLPPLFQPTQGAIQNFRLIKQGVVIGTSDGRPIRAEDDFYPILYGEVSYTNTLCWKGKLLKTVDE